MKKIFLLVFVFGFITTLYAQDFKTTPFGSGVLKTGEEKVVNILCYHRFVMRKDKGTKDIYAIAPKLFETQMQWLKDNNYTVINMAKFLDWINGKDKMPDKAVMITIDDGYESIYSKMLPIMKKFGYTGVVYLYKNFCPGGKSALSKEETRKLVAEGWEFGCHSNTHPILTSKIKDFKIINKGEIRPKGNVIMTDAEYLTWLRSEIIEPKAYLEDYTGTTINTFAYPYGTYSKIVEHVIKEAGYEAAFSVVPSFDTEEVNRYSFKRTMVYGTGSMEKFAEIFNSKPIKVTGLYPDDGDVINDRTPELKAEILDDSLLNTATIHFQMGSVDLEKSVYNPTTKMLTYYYENNLVKGTHVGKVCAEGKTGGKYEYSWLFVIGRPTKMNLLEGETNNTLEEGKE